MAESESYSESDNLTAVLAVQVTNLNVNLSLISTVVTVRAGRLSTHDIRDIRALRRPLNSLKGDGP
jgi:hypothetical protein